MADDEDRLESLLSTYLEGAAGEAEIEELAGLLRGNPERLRTAARLFAQHGALAWTFRGGVPALPAVRPARRPWWIAVPIAAAALILLFVVRSSPPGGSPAAVRTLVFQDGVSPGSAYAGTQDSRLSDKDTGVNRGSDGFIEVESSSEEGGKPTVIRWDLREIPPGSEILSVSIGFSVASVSREEDYAVHALRRPWVESEVTWLEYAAGKPWGVPGGKGPEDREAEPLARFRPVRGPVRFELAPAGREVVRRWIDAPESNHGFILLSTARQGEFYAHAREAEVPASRPLLSVTFRPPR